MMNCSNGFLSHWLGAPSRGVVFEPPRAHFEFKGLQLEIGKFLLIDQIVKVY